MDFLIANFGWFLVASLVLTGVAGVLQLRNMRNLHKNFMSDSGGDPFKTMFSGFLPVMVAGLLATGSFGAGVIGLVVYLVKG